MPEFFKKLLGLDKPQVKNLALSFENAKVTGIISAGTAKHRVPRITKYNCEEIGEVIMTPAPAVNNGVVVSLDADSVWTVTGDSHLTSLTLAPGAVVTAPAGKAVTMLVDGTETPVAPGCYTGKILLQVWDC